MSKYAFWGNLGIQVGGWETPLEAKTEEGYFDRACLAPGIRPDASDVLPAVHLEVPLTPVNSASALLVHSLPLTLSTKGPGSTHAWWCSW